MMAKRLIGLILASLVSIFMTKAQDLVYDGITPSPGSEISSFDFVLKFNLSKVIETNGSGEYGVGWVGYHNDKRPEREKSVTIYQGEPSEGIVIGRACSSNYSTANAGFVPSSDVKINIEGALPEPGVKYTVVVTNEFKVFSVGTTAPIANANFDCFTTPLTYTFIGAAPSGDKLSVAGCSINANQSIDVLSEVTFTFSQPVSINSANPLVVKENDAIYVTSVDAALSEDKTSVTYKFDNVPLILSHSYVISLPEGAVSSTVNTSEINPVFNISVTGSSVGHFRLKSSIPSSEQKTIFSTVEGIFDMPAGFNIYVAPPYSLDLYGYLYKNEISEENLIGRLAGTVNSTKNGIIWTNTYALEPGSTYIINKPAGEFRANDISTGKLSNEWYNGEVNIILNTPAIADSGLDPLVFEAPVLNEHGNGETLVSGQKISSLNYIEIPVKDLRYKYNDTYQGLVINDIPLSIYDVTDGNENLVKECSIFIQQRETNTYYYQVLRVAINSSFFSGHKYKMVIPAGSITVTAPLIQHYVYNSEWTYEFEGDTPAEVTLTSCTLKNDAELSEISNVVWNFKGEFVQNPDLSVRLERTQILPTGAPATVNVYGFTSVKASKGTTQLVVAFYDTNEGAFQLKTNQTYKIVVPEGLIYYAGDPSIKNSEMVYNIIPVAKTPEVIKPEYVNLTVEVNGIATVEQQAVKGEKTTINLTPTEDWKVETVSGATQTGGNVYTTPTLTADATVKVELAYDGPWATEILSNVYEIDTENILIYKDGNFIIVEGAKPDQTICVYNIAGLLVNTANSADGMDKVILTVSQNQEYYIVTVAGKAAKIKM